MELPLSLKTRPRFKKVARSTGERRYLPFLVNWGPVSDLVDTTKYPSPPPSPQPPWTSQSHHKSLRYYTGDDSRPPWSLCVVQREWRLGRDWWARGVGQTGQESVFFSETGHVSHPRVGGREVILIITGSGNRSGSSRRLATDPIRVD